MSGLTSLGYQVVWNRLLGAGTGSSTYVFTIILVLFLVGIATGAILLGLIRPTRPLGRRPDRRRPAADGRPGHGRRRRPRLARPTRSSTACRRSSATLLRDFARSTAIIVLPPTIVMGLTFPATAALLGDETGTEGSASGSLLAVNTTGAIVATFVLPFFVIPLIGSPQHAGAARDRQRRRRRLLFTRARSLRPSFRTVGAVAGGGHRGRDRGQPPPRHGVHQPDDAPDRATRAAQVFEATEDEIAPVVAGHRSYPQLWVNGTSMTLITVDTKLMPLLPLMLRPDADRGLVIAFGMGTAFRSALRAGVTADAVELVPSVPGHVQVVLRRRRPGPRRPEGQGHRGRRPEPRGADGPDVRLRGRRPAAADRELRRVGDLVARVLPVGEVAADARRRDGPVGARTGRRSTSSSPTCARSCRCSRTCA